MTMNTIKLASALLCLSTTFLFAQATVPKGTRIGDAVLKAKAAGRTRASIGLPMGEYAAVRGLAETVSESIPILGRVVAAESTHEGRWDVIWTWYKIKVTDNLCGRSLRKGPVPPIAPRSLLPLNSDEILVRVDGGQIDVEGVRLHAMNTGFRPLLVGHTYLLFTGYLDWLRSDDPIRSVATVPYGGGAIFRVTTEANFERLALDDNSLSVGLRPYNGRLDLFRSDVKNYCSGW